MGIFERRFLDAGFKVTTLDEKSFTAECKNFVTFYTPFMNGTDTVAAMGHIM